MKELNINSKELNPESVLKMISRAKENLKTPEEYQSELDFLIGIL